MLACIHVAVRPTARAISQFWGRLRKLNDAECFPAVSPGADAVPGVP